MKAVGRLAVGGEAQRLVRCAYCALDLFGGRAAELLAWSQGLAADRPAEALPGWWAGGTADALRVFLADAGVTDTDGSVEAYRLGQFSKSSSYCPTSRTRSSSAAPRPSHEWSSPCRPA